MGLALSTAAVVMVSLYLFKLTEEYCSSADTAVEILHETIRKSNSCRSRYAKFRANVAGKHRNCQRDRSREPSRIPRKQLAHVFRKSRKLRQFARNAISRNFPKSSNIHYYTSAAASERANMYRYNIRSSFKRNTLSTRLNSRKKCFGKNRSNSSNYCKSKLQNHRTTFTINGTISPQIDVFKTF